MTLRNAIHDSYWLHHASTERRHEHLKGIHRSEIAIVGAGITGLSIAIELLQRGKSVAVYEAGQIGYGTTSASTGHVDAHPEIKPSEMIKKLGIELSRQYVAQRRRAIDVMQQRASEHCDFVRVPAYQYCENVSEEGDLRREFDAAQTIGLDVKWEEDLNVSYMKAGYSMQSMARMNSFAYQLELANQVVQHGGKIFERSMVSFIDQDHATSIKAGEGTAEFDHLVCAVHGNFTNSIRIDLQIPAYQSYALVATVLDPIPDQLMWDNSNPYFYTRRVDSSDPRKLLFGGCDHRTGMGDPAMAAAELENYTRDHHRVETIVHRWSAEFFDPTDGLPLIGLVPGKSNVWIATGLSGAGLTHGTAAGWQLADLITGNTSPLLEKFSPGRFSMGSLASIVSSQAKVLPDYAERVLPARDVSPESLQPGEGTVGNVDGQHAAICRDMNGVLHQRSPVCVHMGGVVRWNPVEQTWDCPVHGGRYAPCGERLYGPPEGNLDPLSAPPAKE